MYLLGNEKPLQIDSVDMYVREYVLEDGDTKTTYKVVDDKSIPAPTLAKRRLVMLNAGVSLKKLGRAVFFLADFIKVSKPDMWFIDSAGLVFSHKKSTRALLQHKKVSRMIPIASGGALIEVQGVPGRFKTLYTPGPTQRYAGMLKIGMGYILYGLYEELHKDSWRLV